MTTTANIPGDGTDPPCAITIHIKLAQVHSDGITAPLYLHATDNHTEITLESVGNKQEHSYKGSHWSKKQVTF